MQVALPSSGPLPRRVPLRSASRVIARKDTQATQQHQAVSELLTDNHRILIKGRLDCSGQHVIISKTPTHTKQDTLDICLRLMIKFKAFIINLAVFPVTFDMAATDYRRTANNRKLKQFQSNW